VYDQKCLFSSEILCNVIIYLVIFLTADYKPHARLDSRICESIQGETAGISTMGYTIIEILASIIEKAGIMGALVCVIIGVIIGIVVSTNRGSSASLDRKKQTREEAPTRIGMKNLQLSKVLCVG
jgi:hypothetical protein